MKTLVLVLGIVALGGAAVMAAQTTAAEQEKQKPAAGAMCVLKVSGMTCGGCAAAVKSAAKKVDGVKDATVSHKEGRAEVSYDPSKTTPDAIARAISEKSGFKAVVQPAWR